MCLWKFWKARRDGESPYNSPPHTPAQCRIPTLSREERYGAGRVHSSRIPFCSPSNCDTCYPPSQAQSRPISTYDTTQVHFSRIPYSSPSRSISHSRTQAQSSPISTWSTQERWKAAAAAFSAITGVKIFSEKDARKQLKQGKSGTPLDIKVIFYGRLSSSQTEADDQEQVFYIPDSAYDPHYDHDFTNYKGDDTNCTRGDYHYQRPAGWNRIAVSVIGKYRNDVWLGQQGWRDGSSPGEWAVSYHGTKIQNVSSIVKDGYDNSKSKRQVYGRGIYSTPDFKVAETYATGFQYKGMSYKCILQNRVNLKKTKAVQSKLGDGTYFVTPNEDDIRPYGVCLKQT